MLMYLIEVFANGLCIRNKSKNDVVFKVTSCSDNTHFCNGQGGEYDCHKLISIGDEIKFEASTTWVTPNVCKYFDIPNPQYVTFERFDDSSSEPYIL